MVISSNTSSTEDRIVACFCKGQSINIVNCMLTTESTNEIIIIITCSSSGLVSSRITPSNRHVTCTVKEYPDFLSYLCCRDKKIKRRHKWTLTMPSRIGKAWTDKIWSSSRCFLNWGRDNHNALKYLVVVINKLLALF